MLLFLQKILPTATDVTTTATDIALATITITTATTSSPCRCHPLPENELDRPHPIASQLLQHLILSQMLWYVATPKLFVRSHAERHIGLELLRRARWNNYNTNLQDSGWSHQDEYCWVSTSGWSSWDDHIIMIITGILRHCVLVCADRFPHSFTATTWQPQVNCKSWTCSTYAPATAAANPTHWPWMAFHFSTASLAAWRAWSW